MSGITKILFFGQLLIALTAAAEVQTFSAGFSLGQDSVESPGPGVYQKSFSLFGRGTASESEKPVVLPRIVAPPSTLTDPETFFQSVGKDEVGTVPLRRRSSQE